MQPVPTISIVTLFLNADIVVKGVLVLLLVASVWSWAVILDKLWRLGAVSRSARVHEARAAMARSPAELWTQSAETGDPAGQVLIAGLEESAIEVSADSETVGERRERVERAMRLVLNGELRRLETHLPFLATLGSAAPFIGSERVDLGDLKDRLARLAADDPDRIVYVRGDRTILYAQLMDALGLVNSAGFTKVSLLAEGAKPK